MIEAAGIPTMTIAVVKNIVRVLDHLAWHFTMANSGALLVSQTFLNIERRILDESLRLIEPMDQPGVRKLVVELESQVELARGER